MSGIPMDDEVIHVYPVNDLREHVTHGIECWCKPRVDEYDVVVHNAMDQREQWEIGRRMS